MAAACSVAYRRLLSRAGTRAASLLWSAARNQSSQNTSSQQRLLPKTSLTSPPYPEIKLPDPLEEAEHHREIVQKVNELIATGQYGRLFAVVHFAARQWKVTSEDLILLNNDIPAECGDRIRMEKVLLVGADDFTLLGKPLLGKDLVRVDATVIEKTESWPKIRMIIRRKVNYKKKTILIQPQTVLRINSIEIAPVLS
ncbi:large ribosomal subunit protein bL21m [Zootoca vivipara]|uniref:large ribosomal subunit protein bL21m n=1 Tax=Zootoca vivipara TaxID=8524 RepID=UPI00159042F5|nr:large ribosomal subunit protein bL21m [Zootoca vivipara]